MLKIINNFENFKHHRKNIIEPIKKPVKSDINFKEVLQNEFRKDQRGVGNPIQR